MDRTKLNISKWKILSAVTEIISWNKKQKFKHMISQRNRGQLIRSPPIIRKINREIKLVFYYFACIEKNASQLFCTSDIENINQAIDIYKKDYKKIPLEWPICTSTDILKTLTKLKANLEKFEKYLLSTFYLLIKFFQKKKIPEEENFW